MEMILRGKKLGFTLTEINDLIGGKQANETPDLEERLEIMTPKPRTRTLASSAFGSGVARLKRPITGYRPAAKT